MKIMLPKTTKFKNMIITAHTVVEVLESDLPKLIKLGAWVIEEAKEVVEKVSEVKEVVAKVKHKGK